MPSRQIPITTDQLNATQRWDLQGVVYCLSGTLKARRAGWSDIAFRWATQTFSGALGAFDGYLGQPAQILRGQTFLPGEGQDSPAVRIPVRNLAFTSGVSLLQLIDDGVYAWEETEASLRVLYQLPSRELSGAVAADYTFLVKDGFFGPPEAIDLDGFQLPLYSRVIGRNRAFRQPRLPGVEFARASGLTLLKQDVGAPWPLVIGKPDSWYRPPYFDGGVRGFTTSAHTSGATDITFHLATEGGEAQLSGAIISGQNFLAVSGKTLYGVPISGAGSVWFIHRQKPVYPARPLGISGSTWDPTSGTIRLSLISGLATDVPKGAMVISIAHFQNRSGSEGITPRYKWGLAGHPMLVEDAQPGIPYGNAVISGNVGFQFPDGSVRIADPSVWKFGANDLPIGRVGDPGTFPEGVNHSPTAGQEATFLYLGFGTTGESYDDSTGPVNIQPPVFFDAAYSAVSVRQQPAFTSHQVLTKIAYPTGGTGTDNANARDGNEATAASLATSAVITLTFNSAPSPFANNSTTESTLWVITQGDITFTNAAGSITFGTADGTGGVNQTWRFTQASPRDYNETVRCVGGIGGVGAGSVVEVWWEHVLETDAANTRTADVVIAGASGTTSGQVEIGAPLEPSEVVFRVRSCAGGFQGRTYFSRASGSALSIFSAFQPQDSNDTVPFSTGTASGLIPYPPSALLAMQAYYMGPRFGSFLDVNSGVYSLSQQRYIADDTRVSFVIQRPLASWSELERDFAFQTRSHIFYGPSGHEIVYMEPASGVAASGVVQEFRLQGISGANAAKQSGRSLLERTRVDEIVNATAVIWDEDYIGRNFRRNLRAVNAESSAIFGQRKDPRGDLRFWAYSPFAGHPTFDAQRAVSGVAQFYADRGAFALTRFAFETAWIAFGVERGSPVRVVYQVAVSPDPDEAFRNVACEVEEIRCDPVDGERYQLVARAVETPARGLPALTWIDRFTEESDLWTTRILASDQWRDRWSIP